MKIEKSEYQALLYQVIEQQTQVSHLKAVVTNKPAVQGKTWIEAKEIAAIFGWTLPEKEEPNEHTV